MDYLYPRICQVTYDDEDEDIYNNYGITFRFIRVYFPYNNCYQVSLFLSLSLFLS